MAEKVSINNRSVETGREYADAAKRFHEVLAEMPEYLKPDEDVSFHICDINEFHKGMKMDMIFQGENEDRAEEVATSLLHEKMTYNIDSTRQVLIRDLSYEFAMSFQISPENFYYRMLAYGAAYFIPNIEEGLSLDEASKRLDFPVGDVAKALDINLGDGWTDNNEFSLRARTMEFEAEGKNHQFGSGIDMILKDIFYDVYAINADYLDWKLQNRISENGKLEDYLNSNRYKETITPAEVHLYPIVLAAHRFGGTENLTRFFLDYLNLSDEPIDKLGKLQRDALAELVQYKQVQSIIDMVATTITQSGDQRLIFDYVRSKNKFTFIRAILEGKFLDFNPGNQEEELRENLRGFKNRKYATSLDLDLSTMNPEGDRESEPTIENNLGFYFAHESEKIPTKSINNIVKLTIKILKTLDGVRAESHTRLR